MVGWVNKTLLLVAVSCRQSKLISFNHDRDYSLTLTKKLCFFIRRLCLSFWRAITNKIFCCFNLEEHILNTLIPVGYYSWVPWRWCVFCLTVCNECQYPAVVAGTIQRTENLWLKVYDLTPHCHVNRIDTTFLWYDSLELNLKARKQRGPSVYCVGMNTIRTHLWPRFSSLLLTLLALVAFWVWICSLLPDRWPSVPVISRSVGGTSCMYRLGTCRTPTMYLSFNVHTIFSCK